MSVTEQTLGDNQDKITQTQLALARIEGMLTATLARHDQRLDQHEDTLKQHEGRLTDKGKLLARHDERILDLEEDNSARLGRITGTIGSLVGLAGLSLAIFNYMSLHTP